MKYLFLPEPTELVVRIISLLLEQIKLEFTLDTCMDLIKQCKLKQLILILWFSDRESYTSRSNSPRPFQMFTIVFHHKIITILLMHRCSPYKNGVLYVSFHSIRFE